MPCVPQGRPTGLRCWKGGRRSPGWTRIDPGFRIRGGDQAAKFGGGWTFVSIFFFVLIAWIIMNIYILVKNPFDPYPFILINLILSCPAAVQAPIIMMSQNRQEMKDGWEPRITTR